MRRVLSFGGGVQSSAMLLMALEGRFGDRPDVAVFADPGWETKATYAWIERIKAIVAPFPVVHLREKNIRQNASPWAERSGQRFVTLPTYLEGGGMGRRQCTKEFKLQPLQRYWRSLGATAKNPVECWIGISTDEAMRMKPSRVKYAVNRYPLIEAGLSREACQQFLIAHVGAPAPKSSCIGCPFHGDDYWARLRAESPAEFEDACLFDEEIRGGFATTEPVFSSRQQRRRDEVHARLSEIEDEAEYCDNPEDAPQSLWQEVEALESELAAMVPERVVPAMRNQQFLHRSCIPLRDIKEFKHERQLRMFEDAFGNECEGMCGL